MSGIHIKKRGRELHIYKATPHSWVWAENGRWANRRYNSFTAALFAALKGKSRGRPK